MKKGLPVLVQAGPEQSTNSNQELGRTLPARIDAASRVEIAMPYIKGDFSTEMSPFQNSQMAQSGESVGRGSGAAVAVACCYCRKMHLKCDNTRPCQRCQQAGKEV